MIELHEDKVILHTMLSKVNEMHDKQREHESLLKDVFTVLESMYGNQKTIKEKLFLGNKSMSTTEKQEEERKDTEEEKIVIPETIITETSAQKVEKKQDDIVPKQNRILFVADSHGHNLDANNLELAIGAKVDTATAYTIDEDEDTKYRNKNFMKIVPERLKHANYDTLVLQGGCNEISNFNLNTKDILTWKKKVKVSREKIFKLAEDSLRDNPRLKKVIILKTLPRYEKSSSDPDMIKSKLNEFGNSQYTNIWMEKGCPRNIVIEDQNMECQGQLRIKRFGNPGYKDHDGKPWDGIHMRGRLGTKHYTSSIIRIFTDLKLNTTKSKSSQQSYHSTCPQAQYQEKKLRQMRNNRGADNSHPWRKQTQNKSNYHETCPQAQFQRAKVVQQPWQNIEARQSAHEGNLNWYRVSQKNTQKGFKRNNVQNTRYYQDTYNIPTANRFNLNY